jgi:DNA adenine methylase
MDYSTKTRDELIALCKEKKIKGYSGKKKNDIISLLHSSVLIVNPLLTKKLNKNTSPLRYPGGKTRAISILESYVNTYFPNRTILLSPFFGGGSFELYMTTKNITIYANDLFAPLYTFWKVKQEQSEILVNKIKEQIPINKEKFQRIRNQIMEEKDELTVATYYFIINRTSFSGATLSGGFSKQAAESRLTESSLTRLQECDLSQIIFTNLDCNQFLDYYPENDASFIYADPPYYIETYIYGKNGDMHSSFNHDEFAKQIKQRKDWIISYNDCKYIRDLYNDCRIFEAKWAYGMNTEKKSSEIIILPPF